MTFATVSPQGALLRPCSPSSPNNRNRQLHFHVNTQSTSVIPGSGHSQLSQPVISVLPTSVTLQSIPRSSSGQYSFTPSAIILHPDLRQNPPQSILILPGSARSRIITGIPKSASQEPTDRSVPEPSLKYSPPRGSKRMAATVATSPGSSAHTPQHAYYSQVQAHQTHFHYSQQDGSSPTMATAHYTPPRLVPQMVTGTGNQIIQIRTVQKPIEALVVDGENPFRPEGKLFREAEEDIQQWVRPTSATPSPLPDDVVVPHIPQEELDKEFPLLAHHHHNHNHVTQTQVSTASSASKEKERSKSVTSSSSSSAPGSVPQVAEHDEPRGHGHETVVRENDENVPPRHTDTYVRDETGGRNGQKSATVTTVVDEDIRHRGEGSSQEKDTSHKHNKKDKKKRKPVGCGGDKRCTIM